MLSFSLHLGLLHHAAQCWIASNKVHHSIEKPKAVRDVLQPYDTHVVRAHHAGCGSHKEQNVAPSCPIDLPHIFHLPHSEDEQTIRWCSGSYVAIAANKSNQCIEDIQDGRRVVQ